jgi:hypothetical protein
MDDVRARMISQVMKELEELEASAAVAAALPPSRRRSAGGPSAVFTLRLARDELNALEVRARAFGIKPSVLARNLIRVGLTASPSDRGVSAVLDKLETAMDELRALVA